MSISRPLVRIGLAALAVILVLGVVVAARPHDEPPAGVYKEQIPDASNPRQFTLTLAGNKSAKLAVIFAQNRQTEQTGTWEAQGNRVAVNFDHLNNAPFSSQIVFELSDRTLVAKEWEPELFGTDPLKMTAS